MPSTSIAYTKATTATAVTVSYTVDSLVVSGNQADFGVYLTVNPPDITVANSTITAGTTGSGISTITTTTTNGFSYIPVGSTITLSTAGGAAIPSSAVVTSKPNNTTLIIDKEATSNSTSTGSSTIVAAIAVANYALCKVNLTLDGLTTSAYNPKCTVYYYDGTVKYASANAGNAAETQTTSKSINMQNFLKATGVQPVDTNSADVSS